MNVLGIGRVASLSVDDADDSFKRLADFFQHMLGVRAHLETVCNNIRHDAKDENRGDPNQRRWQQLVTIQQFQFQCCDTY
jgi:hypothetical protein